MVSQGVIEGFYVAWAIVFYLLFAVYGGLLFSLDPRRRDQRLPRVLSENLIVCAVTGILYLFLYAGGSNVFRNLFYMLCTPPLLATTLNAITCLPYRDGACRRLEPQCSLVGRPEFLAMAVSIVFTNLGGFFLKFVRLGISDTLAYVVYALLFLPFLYALLNLWKLYRMAPADLAFIGGFGKALLVINYVAWLLYPLGYVLGPFFAGAVSDNAEQLFYVVGDLLVKVLVPIYVVYALWTACGDCAPEPRRDCYEEPDPCEMHAYSDDCAPARKGVPTRQGFTLSDWAKRVSYR